MVESVRIIIRDAPEEGENYLMDEIHLIVAFFLILLFFIAGLLRIYDSPASVQFIDDELVCKMCLRG